MEAQRYCSNEGYVPKWKRVSTYGTPPDINKRCGNPICANLKCERLIKPSFAPLDEIKAFLNLHSLEGTFALCQKCYCYAYNVFHPKETCKSCGAVPKAGETFNRHSPDPQTVTEHLRSTIDSDINITPQDVICLKLLQGTQS